MDFEIRTYLRYSRDIRLVLKSIGVWSSASPIKDRIIAHLGQMSTTAIIFGYLIFIRQHSGNVLLISKYIGLCISALSAFVKICVFLRYQDDLAYLNNYLSVRYRRDLSNLKDRPRLLRHVTICACFFYIVAFVVALAFISAEVGGLRAYAKGAYRSLYPLFFPVDHQPDGFLFWTFVVLHNLAGYYIWAVTNGVDSIFGMYTLELCGELRVLANRLEDLKSSKDYKIKLRECVTRHHVIIKSRDALQNVFGFLSIWLAITSAIVQCSVVFQAKMELKTMTSANIGFLFFYILMKFIQAFTYSWYGSLIAEESLLCVNAMYNAQWPGSGNLHIMNDVLTILSQKPMIFKGEGFMSLNMGIFVKILNMAVSYFFLLQTLDNKSHKY